MADIVPEAVAATESEESSNPKKRQREEDDIDEDGNPIGGGNPETEGTAGASGSLDENGFRPRPNKLPRFTSPEHEGDLIAKRRVMKHSNLFIDRTKPVSGILLCCQQAQEMQAVSKMLPMFAKYLYMYEKEKSGEAIPVGFKIPLKEIQDTRFAPYNTGVKGLGFLAINNVVPSDFLKYAFEKFRQDKSMPRKSKVERVLPCDTIVAGRMHVLTEALKPIIQTHFGGLKPIRYCVMLRTRNNPYLEDKDSIVRDVAALVPPRHIVDLKNPELIILIEIFKSAAAITVLDYYFKLNKLNLNLYINTTDFKPHDASDTSPEPTSVAATAVQTETETVAPASN
eukprot:TRINITY_DN7073_c0_g1_i1.p1 TRINITY_DN7073_c0_g1~~TRINITY_DN7073_c0_g1_i1.p1  ORF type:complete len:341 (-),score=73.79 TRINITY_DN7073_c0_g1_i1:30-1052(-)